MKTRSDLLVDVFFYLLLLIQIYIGRLYTVRLIYWKLFCGEWREKDTVKIQLTWIDIGYHGVIIIII